MHYLLKRQIKKIFGEEYLKTTDEKLKAFFDAVNYAYVTSDEDRKLIEHSLEVGSREIEWNFALLKTAINAIDVGVLCLDNKKESIVVNKSFLNMLGLQSISGVKGYVELLVKIKNKVINSSPLINILEHPGDINKIDRLEFYDGRVLEVLIKDFVLREDKIGRIFVFYERTEISRGSHELEMRLREIEKLNSFMVNRELDMINLKKRIKELESNK